MHVPPTSDLAALLSDERWLRRLARGLTADRATAEDLAQEAVLTALSSPIRSGAARPRDVRAWLTGVARNLWRDLARSGARRARREQLAARPEATPATDELVAEVELRRRVAELVLELEAPQRRALVLRFFQGRSLADVARHEGVALSTAHERVEQALASLRRRLAAEREEKRGSWALALARLAQPEHGILLAGSGGMGIGGKVGMAVLALAGLLGGWRLLGVGGEGRQGAFEGARETPGAEDGVEVGATTARLAPGAAPRASAPGEPDPDAASSALGATLRGVVREPDGSPIAGVPLALWDLFAPEAEDVSAHSAADGSFELALPPASRDPRPLALDPGRAVLSAQAAEGLWTIVLTATSAYAGVIVDTDGLPVPEAAVSIEPSSGYFREHGLLRPLTAPPPTWSAHSDGAGRFQIASAPAGEGVGLRVRRSGYEPARVQPERGGELGLRIVLQPAEGEVLVEGVVLDPRGEPLPGALVLAGGTARATSDAEGRFTLPWRPAEQFATRFPDGSFVPWTQTHATAVAAGYGPVRKALFEHDATQLLVLRLGEPLAITGRVLDPTGAPLAGVRVWLADPTWLVTPVEAPSVSAGPQSVEGALRADVPGTTTDAEGRFTLDQLLARPYALAAFDPDSASLGGPWEVEPGAGEPTLVLVDEPGRVRVAGRVLGADGEPLVGAMVFAQRDAPGATGETLGLLGSDSERGLRQTDAEGRFEFAALALGGTSLGFFHQSTYLFTLALADQDDLEHLEVRAPRLCELQVELRDPGMAREARVLDAGGAPLHAVRFLDNSAYTAPSLSFDRSGRSDVVLLPDTARTLVLLDLDGEVLRLPIRLDPERPTLLRP